MHEVLDNKFFVEYVNEMTPTDGSRKITLCYVSTYFEFLTLKMKLKIKTDIWKKFPGFPFSSYKHAKPLVSVNAY